MQLFEKYRPSSLDEIVGQDKAVSVVRRLADGKNLLGKAYWITGKSGTGKTTLARVIADMVANSWCIDEIDASECTPAFLRGVESGWSIKGMGKTGRVFLINESHGLNKQAVRQLLVMLERIPPHVIVIFTTTLEGNTLFEGQLDGGPLLSRCVPIRLSDKGLADSFAQRAMQIAVTEGLDGKPLKAYLALARECKHNFRMMLSRIEAGEMMTDPVVPDNDDDEDDEDPVSIVELDNCIDYDAMADMLLAING